MSNVVALKKKPALLDHEQMWIVNILGANEYKHNCFSPKIFPFKSPDPMPVLLAMNLEQQKEKLKQKPKPHQAVTLRHIALVEAALEVVMQGKLYVPDKGDATEKVTALKNNMGHMTVQRAWLYQKAKEK